MGKRFTRPFAMPSDALSRVLSFESSHREPVAEVSETESFPSSRLTDAPAPTSNCFTAVAPPPQGEQSPAPPDSPTGPAINETVCVAVEASPPAPQEAVTLDVPDAIDEHLAAVATRLASLRQSSTDSCETPAPPTVSEIQPCQGDTNMPSTINDPLAVKYNVRQITSREMTRLGMELYQAGRIGREEMAMLSFQPEMNANYDAVGAQGVKRPDPDTPRDVLAEWQSILARQESFGNSSFFTDKTRAIIDILEALDASRGES
jgi:hypothetical protein